MTNKDKLQAEILAKIKEGVKPSDLKKPRTQAKAKKEPNPSKSPNLSPYVNGQKDQGYESEETTDRHESPVLNTGESQAKPSLEIQSLQNQITSLKKQLQLYKDFREGDLKI